METTSDPCTSTDGFRKVSKAEFFSAVGGPRDIHPTPEEFRSVWKDQKTREVVGISTPGYLRQTQEGVYCSTSRYYLTR